MPQLCGGGDDGGKQPATVSPARREGRDGRDDLALAAQEG